MDYMARALQLASRALGTVSPNPAVGAVLVRDGRIVGEGATQPPGEAHAEIVALRAAGPLARGSTLYVTLEPCAHYGRTPPCADAIVKAGIAEVHVAMLDPSPWVDGHGITVLEQAGIRVQRGSHEAPAKRLNEAYLCWLVRGRPLVTALYALGLDGRHLPLDAEALGVSAQTELARLRATADRMVTDLGPLLAEDPTLTGLAALGVTALHVEAPPHELAALTERGLLDRVVVLVAPTLGVGLEYERLGDTLLVRGSVVIDGVS
jgi:diaminohydroxyphosphoribosylaminopyrimidine deaminase/5-amino-6-(5-phosphoribosylamino)uracil reductase